MSEKEHKIILVVDDNRDAADTMAILLRTVGCYVFVAYDTMSGIAIARASSPDFIFHDVGLPIVNGYDAARYFRTREQFFKTVLVAVTAYDSTEDRRRAISAGFDIHLSKPVEIEDLKDILSRARPP